MTNTTGAAQDWSAVADAWDTHVDYVDEHSSAETNALLDRIAVQPGERVLELASGPGSLGARLSALVGPTGSVVLSDIAPGMVDVAARRNAHLDNVTTAVIDVSAIDRPDNSFDAVVCRMGLMFTLEPSVAFAEMKRVLDANGRLGALTWGGIEHNPWMTCVGMSAMMNGLVSGGPPVGAGGIFSLSDPAALEALATAAGFVDVKVEAFDIAFRSPDIDTHLARVSSLAGPMAAVFAAATPEQLAAVRRTSADLSAQYATDDGLVIPGRANLLTARVT